MAHKKLGTYCSWEFFCSAAPTAQNIPELHFCFINSFIQRYLVGFLSLGNSVRDPSWPIKYQKLHLGQKIQFSLLDMFFSHSHQDQEFEFKKKVFVSAFNTCQMPIADYIHNAHFFSCKFMILLSVYELPQFPIFSIWPWLSCF